MRFVFDFPTYMSVNKMYYIKGHGKVLTTAARNLRARIINETLKQLNGILTEIDKDRPIKVIIHFTSNWFTQENTIRHKDIDNPLKFLIDSVFKAIDVDDSRIFDLRVLKVQSSETELTTIDIENDTGIVYHED